MWNNVIGEHVRRTTRNLLLVNALLLAGLALLAWGNGRYLYNALLGPFEVDHQTLAATANPGAATRYFVTVTGDERFETGFHAITRTVDKYSRAVGRAARDPRQGAGGRRLDRRNRAARAVGSRRVRSAARDRVEGEPRDGDPGRGPAPPRYVDFARLGRRGPSPATSCGSPYVAAYV